MIKRRLFPCAALVLLALPTLVLPSPAAAQRLPAMPGSQGGTAGQHMAEYYAHVMQKIATSMETWRGAWSSDDVEALVDHYTDDAVLLLPGAGAAWGRDAIREALAGPLGRAGQAQAAIGDVKASGRLAYVGGSFQIEIQEGERAGERLTGFHSTVFFREGGDWLIRSQVFRVEGATDPAW